MITRNKLEVNRKQRYYDVVFEVNKDCTLKFFKDTHTSPVEYFTLKTSSYFT